MRDAHANLFATGFTPRHGRSTFERHACGTKLTGSFAQASLHAWHVPFHGLLHHLHSGDRALAVTISSRGHWKDPDRARRELPSLSTGCGGVYWNPSHEAADTVAQNKASLRWCYWAELDEFAGLHRQEHASAACSPRVVTLCRAFGAMCCWWRRLLGREIVMAIPHVTYESRPGCPSSTSERGRCRRRLRHGPLDTSNSCHTCLNSFSFGPRCMNACTRLPCTLVR